MNETAGCRISTRRRALICWMICLSPFLSAARLIADDSAEPDQKVEDPQAALLQVGADDSAEDLWARALWLSLTFNQTDSEKVSRLFTVAVTRSKAKGPLYVSLGDASSGPNVFREMFEELTNSILVEGVREFVDGQDISVGEHDQEAWDQKRRQTLQRSFSKVVQGSAIQSQFDTILNVAAGETDASIECYLAAVAEEPTLKVAWYRLATHVNDENEELFVQEYLRQDPDNAIAHYLMASLCLRQHDFPAALQSVQNGNMAAHCEIPRPVRPQKFDYHYPDTPEMRELGIAGKVIGAHGLDFWLSFEEDCFSFTDPLPKLLREISRVFTAKAVRLIDKGNREEAIAYLETLHGMGLQLMQESSKDGILIITGLALARTPVSTLKDAYSSERSQQRQRLERTAVKCESFWQELRKVIEVGKVTKENFIDIVDGKFHPREERARAFAEALQKHGLNKSTAEGD